jgi:hypothetical protein
MTGTIRACSGPGQTDTPTSPLDDGAYVFEAISRDAGNLDATPASLSFSVGRTDRSVNYAAKAKAHQRLANLAITVAGGERITATLGGAVVLAPRSAKKTRVKLGAVTRTLPVGAAEDIRLKAKRPGVRRIARRLDAGAGARAEVELTVRDAAGNVARQHFSVQLRP